MLKRSNGTKKMSINEIKHGEMILARHIPCEDLWTPGLCFFSNDSEYLQVGTWVYDSGKILQAHTHNVVSRNVTVTQEVLYVSRGKIMADIFDPDGNIVDTLEVGEGDLIILLFGGHGYRIVSDGTRVIEIKNGPYLGAELDRRRFAQ